MSATPAVPLCFAAQNQDPVPARVRRRTRGLLFANSGSSRLPGARPPLDPHIISRCLLRFTSPGDTWTSAQVLLGTVARMAGRRYRRGVLRPCCNHSGLHPNDEQVPRHCGLVSHCAPRTAFLRSLSVTAQAWCSIASRWGGCPSGGGRIKWAKPIRPRMRRRSRRTRATTKPVGAGLKGRGGEAGEAPEQTPLSSLTLDRSSRSAPIVLGSVAPTW